MAVVDAPTCGSCGAGVPGGARFCPSCGASQSVAAGERRIATVLYADVVGFTALAEHRDPEQVKRLIDGWFEQLAGDITAFGGVIDKVLGDGIVALFGAPIAHEDDAERAVRAGLHIQNRLAAAVDDGLVPIQMRVGINTGEVLVGASAGGDYTAMGDVMNLGARLEQLADPGQVLVSAATRDATQEAIAYRPAGVLTAVGREQRVEAWIAEEPLRRPGERRQRSTRFVGRGLELNSLLAQAELAIGRERSHLAAVVGDAGVGKTRLVTEVAARLGTLHGATVLTGRCVPYGEANVWWPAAELLRDLFGVGSDATIDEARAALSPFIELARGDHDQERLETALLHALGHATALRGGDRQRNRSEVTLALTLVVSQLLERGPLVVVLSDIHWAAEAIWALLDHLLTQLSRAQLVVLVTARHVDDELPFARWHGSSVTQLGPLTDAGARAMLEQLDLGSLEVTDELVRRSGGNPFFLEELSSLAADRGLEAVGGVGVGPIVPDSLRGLIAARLDGVDPAVRLVLDDAAVLGRTGPMDGLRVIASETRGDASIDAELAALESSDLLEFSGSRYSFRSDLVREVAYGMLTKADRVARHLGIARHLESSAPAAEIRNSIAAAIAEHFRAALSLVRELGGLPDVDLVDVTERAEHWVHDAGRRALDAGEPTQGEQWMSSGLDLFTGRPSMAAFRLGRAEARCEVRNLEGARSDLDHLIDLPDVDDVQRARALVVLGDVERKAHALESAVSLLAQAGERLETLGEHRHAALAFRLLGLAQMDLDHPAARESMERSREIGEAIDDDRTVAWATQNLAWLAFREGRVAHATEHLREARRIFGDLGDRGGLVWVEGIEAWVAFHTGDWERSAVLVERVTADAIRRGDPWAQAIMGSLKANLELWSGRAEAARTTARAAVELADRASDIGVATQGRCLEARALISRGFIEEGLRVLADAHDRAELAADPGATELAVVINAASRARIGDSEDALRWAARSQEGYDDPAVLAGVDLFGSVILALLQQGAVEAAAAQIGELTAIEGPIPGFLSTVAALVAASEGRIEDARARAESLLEGRGTYLDRVMAHGVAAAVACRVGDTATVRAHLDAASSILDGTDDRVSVLVLGIVRALLEGTSPAAIEDELAALGGRPEGWTRLWATAAGLPEPSVSS